MPVYCYRECDAEGNWLDDEWDESGRLVACRVHARVFRFGAAPPQIVLETGVVAKRDFSAERPGTPPTQWSQGLKSLAAACHPDDVAEEMAICKKHGVSVEYHEDGSPVFRSRLERKKYCKLFGIFDKDAGYSDPTL